MRPGHYHQEVGHEYQINRVHYLELGFYGYFAGVGPSISPVGAMKQLRQDKPYIVKAFGGIITGALVGLVINDSGIVAASTTSIYLVVPLLLLMLHYEMQPSKIKQ